MLTKKLTQWSQNLEHLNFYKLGASFVRGPPNYCKIMDSAYLIELGRISELLYGGRGVLIPPEAHRVKD